MRRTTTFGTFGTFGSAGLAVLAMVSVQSGAAVSTWMFDAAGPIGTAFLRLVWASLVLLVAVRPRIRGTSRRSLFNVAALGAMSAMMTICYFLAVARIPLGVASSLEFLGPLTVAVWGLRGRRGALLWPVLAAAGVLMIARPWDGGAQLTGVLIGTGAGACLGGYVVFTQKIGDEFAGLQGLALSLTVAAVCAAPFGLPQAAGHLADPTILLGSALAAILLPLLPYALELRALRTLSTAALGTLMSFEPAVATLIGLLLLGQSAGVLQCAGIACVTGASLGAVYGGNRARADSRSPREEAPGVREPVAVAAPDPVDAPSGK